MKRYIGDKAFYRRVLGIAVPIIVQNAITNFVNLLDNLMVGLDEAHQNLRMVPQADSQRLQHQIVDGVLLAGLG